MVDLLASRDPSHRVTAFPATLEGLSDHTVQLVVYPGLVCRQGGPAAQGALEQRRFYQWIEGECLNEYAEGSRKWQEHTSHAAFTDAVRAIVRDRQLSVAEQLVEFERFMLE